MTRPEGIGVGTGVQVDEWVSCYADSWQDLIVPDAFAHP